MSHFSDRHLHVISFDIPVPINYGGAIDIFYKLKALSEKGVSVHLHCFKYGGRTPSAQLKEICHKVYYYSRKNLAHDIIGNTPYIVNSRRDEALIDRLLEDQYPILFEGLHSCYYLNDPRLKGRKKVVRTHNIEHEYYSNLARTEKNYLRRFYFQKEAKDLKSFEKNLKFADWLAVISQNDYKYFSKKYKNVHVVSAFHPNESVDILPGFGDYVLYHGSLEVNENHHAAMFLVHKVFNDLPFRLIIAGNKPRRELVQSVENVSNVEIRTGLTIDQIHHLVENAQVNLLPTFQATGIKLKLLLALYKGRHCLVNTPMVVNTGLEELCVIADDPEAMKQQINELFKIEMSAANIESRKKILLHNGFMNTYNADVLISGIFND